MEKWSFGIAIFEICLKMQDTFCNFLRFALTFPVPQATVSKHTCFMFLVISPKTKSSKNVCLFMYQDHFYFFLWNTEHTVNISPWTLEVLGLQPFYSTLSSLVDEERCLFKGRWIIIWNIGLFCQQNHHQIWYNLLIQLYNNVKYSNEYWLSK